MHTEMAGLKRTAQCASLILHCQFVFCQRWHWCTCLRRHLGTHIPDAYTREITYPKHARKNAYMQQTHSLRICTFMFFVCTYSHPSASETSAKGSRPHSIANKITPRLHTSRGGPTHDGQGAVWVHGSRGVMLCCGGDRYLHSGGPYAWWIG